MKEINIEGQLIYVAHPYGGNEENIRRAAECLRKLKKNVPVSNIILTIAQLGLGLLRC